MFFLSKDTLTSLYSIPITKKPLRNYREKLLVTEGIIVHVQKTIFTTFKNYQRKEQPTVLSIFLNEKFMVNIQNIQQRGK